MRTLVRVSPKLNRAASGIFTMVLAIAATLAVTGTPASAYALHNCRVAARSGYIIDWTDSTGGGSYGFVAHNSVMAWHNTATPIVFSKVPSGGHFDIRQGNFGNTGFDGITAAESGLFPTCGGNGTWSTKLRAWWNTDYTDSYPSEKKQSVMAHEIGHVLGVAHSGVGPCVSVPLAYPATSTRWDACRIKAPKQDDMNAVNFIY